MAEGTRYRTYLQIEARVLLTAGYRLWPTESFDDNGPDRRNEVHYDLIVLSGRDLGLAELGGSKQQRAAARERLAPAVRSLLSVLGKPIDLSRPKDAQEVNTLGHNMAAEGGALMARTITKPVVAIEVAPHARPDGFVYVHDVQLEGDEDLRLGTRVEVQDEGGSFLAATVDAISTDRLGRRYRLRLGA